MSKMAMSSKNRDTQKHVSIKWFGNVWDIPGQPRGKATVPSHPMVKKGYGQGGFLYPSNGEL